jgi:hypothetical protein
MNLHAAVHTHSSYHIVDFVESVFECLIRATLSLTFTNDLDNRGRLFFIMEAENA